MKKVFGVFSAAVRDPGAFVRRAVAYVGGNRIVSRPPRIVEECHTEHRASGPQVIIVGSNRDGLRIKGLGRPNWFFPRFFRTVKSSGLEVQVYDNPRRLYKDRWKYGTCPCAIITLFNEENTKKRELYDIAECVSRIGAVRTIFNSPDVARILRDKLYTNQLLSDSGIRTPRVIMGSSSKAVAFQNSRLGSKKPTSIRAAGEALNDASYNTEFIDTTFAYKNTGYYVSLRAYAVGQHLISVYIRARSVTEKNASVHTQDTPLEPELLNRIHKNVVTNNIDKLEALCVSAGKALGLGFYVYDILPEINTGEFFISEAGFKFDDGSYREHLWPIAGATQFMARVYDGREIDDASCAFLEHLLAEGFPITESRTGVNGVSGNVCW